MSLVEGDFFENIELARKVNNVTNYEEAVQVVREYETIIKLEKKVILNVT